MKCNAEISMRDGRGDIFEIEMFSFVNIISDSASSSGEALEKKTDMF